MEIIKIHIHNGKNVVSARELHDYLGSKREFTTWIKNRIQQYDFKENEDYTSFDKFVKRENGSSVRKEYAITLDMAKELAMIENNEKGKQARKYFIEAEKIARGRELAQPRDYALPSRKTLAEWVIEGENKIKAQQEEIEKLESKTVLLDQIVKTDSLIDIGQVAKILGLPFGRNTLFAKLREEGVFFKNKNEPLQRYVDQGLFRLKEKMIEATPPFVVIKVLVTQKGLVWLGNKYGVQENKLARIV